MRPKREVLQLDDDPQMTQPVAKGFTPYGYQIVPRNVPAEAINELIRKNCRVVVLDIDMPGMTGGGSRRGRGLRRRCPVIMQTGIVTMSSMLEAIRLSAGGYRGVA